MTNTETVGTERRNDIADALEDMAETLGLAKGYCYILQNAAAALRAASIPAPVRDLKSSLMVEAAATDTMRTERDTVEAEVKRLTEEKEALGGGLSEERREVAAGQAWDFVKPGLVAMNQDKGPAGVWSAGFRSGWYAATRAALSGGKE